MSKNLEEKISKISISKDSSILNALKKMDELNLKLLIVNNKNSFKSLLSIGDIQRAIIKGKNLSTPIDKILREDITVCYEKNGMKKVKSEMIKYRTEFMPIVKKNGEIKDVIFWKDVFTEHYSNKSAKLNIPVVIMAGGKGTRLKPITDLIPKPLVPLGDKPIIQIIAERFSNAGMKKFFIILNYKAEMIENYFTNLKDKKYKLEYFYEEDFLGTAGSLYFLKNKIKSTFFVSNCDILIDQDFSEVYKYHRQNKNELTIIGALKHYSIPYGTLKVQDGGYLKSLKEKPEITFMINSGMYIVEPHLLNEIPKNKYFHITELIDKIKNRNGRVGVFPVSEMSWLDIGNLDEFNRSKEIFLKKNSF